MADQHRPDEPQTFGRYTLIRRLAVGGMGEILLAQVEQLAGLTRPCVIKTIRPGLAATRDFVERFVAEARVVASLSHGNIVPVYDVGQVGEAFYIAMEYVAGKDLSRVCGALGGRPLPLPLALYVAREVANGLAYAHGNRVGGLGQLVHRDVSPQNVLLSYEGQVKLIDFGLARTERSQLTGEGIVIGKVRYMAPEQACGEAVDQRTDVYALGLVLFELLTGEPFFTQQAIDQLLALVAAPLIHPPSKRAPQVPKALDRICLRAMSPDPARRYPSAAELRDDLSAALAQIAPRTSQEQLGALVRELFADEVADDEAPLSGLAPAAAPPAAFATAPEDALAGASLLGGAPAPIQLIPTLVPIEARPTLCDAAALADPPPDDEEDTIEEDEGGADPIELVVTAERRAPPPALPPARTALVRPRAVSGWSLLRLLLITVGVGAAVLVALLLVGRLLWG